MPVDLAEQRLGKLVLAGLTLLAGGGARAQGAAGPMMLVAKPDMRAAYSQTVLVVVPFGDGEHLSPRSPGGESLPLFADLFVASRADDIDRIIEQTPQDARFFIGFVGWHAGELDAEIAKGFWYVLEPRAELVFRKDSGGLWRELVRSLGIEPGNPGARAVAARGRG